jgi:hypothetical protein
MLESTGRTVATQTTYTVPANTTTIPDHTSDGMIRPTSVVVAEKDGKLLTVSFYGPRQLGSPASGQHDSDARDTGASQLYFDDTKVTVSEAQLLNEVFDLHLRSTVHVLTDEEAKEVLAKYV